MAYTEQDIKELKDIIALGHYKPNLINQYKSLYFRVFNNHWRGCNCAASSMFYELQAFLTKNINR